MMKKRKLRIGSDFSGVGAFEFSLKRLGISYVNCFACDKDKYARQTYLLNHEKPNDFPTDVYERKIPEESLDIYMTSPPCQAFSQSGKRLGKEDKRGILFFNSHQFIKKNKPRYFIFENVEGLTSIDEGKTFQEWLNYLGGKSINGLPVLFPEENAVPYHLYYKIINAKDFNIPQNRKRIFIVGIRDDENNFFQFPKEERLIKNLSDLLEEKFDLKYILRNKDIDDLIINKKFKKNNINVLGNTQPSGTGMNGKIYDVKGICPTISTNKGEGIKIKSATHKNIIRRLTPKECFKLMDFPGNFIWKCSDNQAYKQAGNSIVVKCLEKIIDKFRL